MSQEFTGIKITGIDEKDTRRVEGYNLYDITFQLSARTPGEWTEIVEALYKRAMYNMKRSLTGRGSTLTLHGAGMDDFEIQQHHEELPKIVAEANAVYRQHLTRQAAQREREHQQAETERARIADIANRFKFD